MADLKVMLEAERRGLLNERQKAVLQEARRRGLAPVPGIPEPQQAIVGQKEAFKGPLQRADDLVRSVASGATFGLADEAAALANTLRSGRIPSFEDIFTEEQESPYARNLAAERARDLDIRPSSRFGGELLGAIGGGTGLAKGGLSLLKGARRTFPSLMGRGAAEGAAYGGAHGLGRGEGVEDRLKGGAIGATTGAATGAGLGAIARGLGGSYNQPTTAAVKAEATAAYKQAEQAGVIVKSAPFAKAVDRIEQKLAKLGADKDLHPAAIAAYKRLKKGSQSNQTLEGMEILRRVIGSAAKSTNEDERMLAMTMMDELDDFVTNLKPSDTMAGPTTKAVTALKRGRRLWRMSKTAEGIEDMVERAGTRAGQFTGSGFENALRTEFRQLALNPKRMRRFTKTEQTFIKKVAQGTPLGNALRYLGKFAPRGIVSTALSGGIGYGMGGELGMMGALMGGEIGRAGATAVTRANVQRVLDEVLSPATMGPVTLQPRQAQMLRSALLTAIEAERGLTTLRPGSRSLPAR